MYGEVCGVVFLDGKDSGYCGFFWFYCYLVIMGLFVCVMVFWVFGCFEGWNGMGLVGWLRLFVVCFLDMSVLCFCERIWCDYVVSGRLMD